MTNPSPLGSDIVATAEKRPLVLVIPGLSGSSAPLAGAATRMFPQWEVVAFDHRVAGGDATIELLAEHALAALPDGTPAFVCGESFGGAVALTLARRHPERVLGLILLSTFAHLPSARRMHTAPLVAIWSHVVERAPLLARAARVAGLPGQFGRPVSWGTARDYIKEPLSSGPDYRAKVALLARFDARPWLGEIMASSIVLYGRRDPIVPIAAARELAALLPDCWLYELDCGHLGYLALPERIGEHVEHWRQGIRNL